MKTYTVVAPGFRINMGAVIGLSEEQLASRSHRVDLVDTKGELKIVQAREPLDFKTGEIVGLADEPEKNMAHLVEEVEGSRKPSGRGPAKKPAKTAELNAAILSAAAKLQPSNPEHFTADGKPQVKALEAVLGYDIDAADRDAAWAAKPA